MTMAPITPSSEDNRPLTQQEREAYSPTGIFQIRNRRLFGSVLEEAWENRYGKRQWRRSANPVRFT